MSTIAIDADGVLVNYNTAYAGAWKAAFGVDLIEKDPLGFTVFDQYENIEILDKERLEYFHSHTAEDFWIGMDLYPGVREACKILSDKGHELVCVSALPARFAPARQKCWERHGLPIASTYGVGHSIDEELIGVSPKAQLLNDMKPEAFVDDFITYFSGVNRKIHCALIMRGGESSPNKGPAIQTVHSRHADLLNFAVYWEQRANGN